MAIPKQFDALIIGGGPAGATAATLLAQAGWTVAIVEKANYPRRKVCGEFVSATSLPVLRALCAEKAFRDRAGPPVQRVGLFAGTTILTAPMPHPGSEPNGFGQALGREHLDTLLLDRAAEAGAAVWQPWTVVQLKPEGDDYACTLESKTTHRAAAIRTRIVIAAHGSWDCGSLPTQSGPYQSRPSDLLGFKAHFRECDLPFDLMPLFVFPGGYGGMVHTDEGRVSFSLCVRRDRLERCRRSLPQSHAGENVLGHVKQSCRGVREALAHAVREGEWLAVGPIRPGIRRSRQRGIFLIGNAAGEAHPLIAEGISMAIQSAWLLSQCLIANGLRSKVSLEVVAVEYARAWRHQFAFRVRAASVFAQWAMRPALVYCLLPCILLNPSLLTVCASWSGKANALNKESNGLPCGTEA